jgi:hypothetical protein
MDGVEFVDELSTRLTRAQVLTEVLVALRRRRRCRRARRRSPAAVDGGSRHMLVSDLGAGGAELRPPRARRLLVLGVSGSRVVFVAAREPFFRARVRGGARGMRGGLRRVGRPPRVVRPARAGCQPGAACQSRASVPSARAQDPGRLGLPGVAWVCVGQAGFDRCAYRSQRLSFFDAELPREVGDRRTSRPARPEHLQRSLLELASFAFAIRRGEPTVAGRARWRRCAMARAAVARPARWR